MTSVKRFPVGWVALSVFAAVLAIGTSLAGIFRPGTYARETPAWAVQAIGQDIANLPVAVVLIRSAVLLRSGASRALFIWLGCLLYFIYAFAIYAFSVHFNQLFLAYVAILGASFYAMVGVLAGLDVTEAVASIRGHPHANGTSNLLIAIGVMFAGLWLSEIVPHTLQGTVPPSLTETALWTNPVHVLDLAFLLPAMIVAGILLKRQHAWGLFLAVPLLVFAVTMGFAILALFALSAMNGLPVAAPAVIVVTSIVIVSVAYSWLLLHRGPQPTEIRSQEGDPSETSTS